MMERYKGYWVSGSAVPGPPNTRYWESLGGALSKTVAVAPWWKSGGFEITESRSTWPDWSRGTGWKLAGYSLIIV